MQPHATRCHIFCCSVQNDKWKTIRWWFFVNIERAVENKLLRHTSTTLPRSHKFSFNRPRVNDFKSWRFKWRIPVVLQMRDRVEWPKDVDSWLTLKWAWFSDDERKILQQLQSCIWMFHFRLCYLCLFIMESVC